MKKVISWLLVILMIAGMTGCEPLAKKFRRKKKETVRMPRIHQVQKYEKKPSQELYKKHFSYWSSWQSELIKVLGKNHKKDEVCIEHIMSNLADMQGILIPEKGAQLAVHIKRLSEVRDVILNEDLSVANRDYVLRTLEREDRYIKRDFSYRKVKSCLRKSFNDEEESSSGTVEEERVGPDAAVK